MIEIDITSEKAIPYFQLRNSTMGRFLIRKYWPKRSVRAKRKWLELKLLIFSINSFSRFREIFENMAVTMYLAGGGNAPCN